MFPFPSIKTPDLLLTPTAVQLEVQKRVKFLLGKGIEEYSRVGILGSGSLEYVLMLYALHSLNAIIVPLNPRDHLSQRVTTSISARISHVVHLLDSGMCTVEVIERAPMLTQDIEASGYLLFTSGTEGPPKGLFFTENEVSAACNASNSITGFGSSEGWLLSLPPYHVGGLAILYRCALSGGTLVIPPSLRPFDLLYAIKSSGVTFMSLVPLMLEELLTAPEGSLLLSLRCILLGGMNISEQVREKGQKLPLFLSYGMTETFSHVTLGKVFPGTASVGFPLPHATFSIEEPQQDGWGQLRIHATSLFARSLREDGILVSRPPEESYLTKDMGRISSTGEIELLGRADSIINSGGEKINPLRIENAAYNIKGVKYAAVIKASHPKWGERPVLIIERAEQELSEQTIKRELSTILSSLEMPTKIIFVENMPRTSLGKIAYQDLRKQFGNKAL